MSDYTINVTANAAVRIVKLAQLEVQPEKVMLRIAVDGGGCSGFQYKFELTTEHTLEDKIFEFNGAKLVVDNISGELMNEATLDYVETLTYANFEIKNPQSKVRCGCGNSFSI
ncbi:HesB/IscA family protein [Rickettsiales endosymbiont of Stachyamoeba lipophora]|uniref:HesB/IscA family protein n=1 Tax=Rickettsiales endosymbiont of Stachyamoeba lipophora TaxID=2486578 RepID=UPI000F648010|nr:iron-sulfur cluster assembly accessory protein [Rickettsiales endosymbiont of Stachyamoeba lipophora]AZL15354.1 iron-sulfur cluster assembly accessory protein [Rickettsiales endosymbiont of Stachyamoeba lipophora]